MDFERDKDLAKDFLSNFLDGDGNLKYITSLREMLNGSLKSLEIGLEDVKTYLGEDFSLRIIQNTKYYQKVFYVSVVEIGNGSDPHPHMPYCEGHIHFKVAGKGLPISDLKACHIGHLVKISGVVTRFVSHCMEIAVYTCKDCGFEVFQEVTASSLPLFVCPSDRCMINQSKGIMTSNIVKCQEAKIQELYEHVRIGSIPRALIVQLMGDQLTTKISPGDIVEVTGINLPMLYTSGLKGTQSGATDTYLEALCVHHLMEHDDPYKSMPLVDPAAVSHTAIMAINSNGVLMFGAESRVSASDALKIGPVKDPYSSEANARKFENLFDSVFVTASGTGSLCNRFLKSFVSYCSTKKHNLRTKMELVHFLSGVLNGGLNWASHSRADYSLNMLVVGNLGGENFICLLCRGMAGTPEENKFVAMNARVPVVTIGCGTTEMRKQELTSPFSQIVQQNLQKTVFEEKAREYVYNAIRRATIFDERRCGGTITIISIGNDGHQKYYWDYYPDMGYQFRVPAEPYQFNSP